MYAPLWILSTSFPGIGGRADDRIRGLAAGVGWLPLVGGRGVASKVVIDGTGGITSTMVVEGADPGIRGTEAMAVGLGTDPRPVSMPPTV